VDRAQTECITAPLISQVSVEITDLVSRPGQQQQQSL